jgi:hypothetical protein
MMIFSADVCEVVYVVALYSFDMSEQFFYCSRLIINEVDVITELGPMLLEIMS